MLNGTAALTPRLVLSLLYRLPEGSYYAAARASAPDLDGDENETPAEPDPAYERRTWTHDRMLMANLINSVNMLVRYSVQWEPGKAPTFPIIGPPEWRETPKKRVSIMDVLNKITGKNV